jgi:hypothetical protein
MSATNLKKKSTKFCVGLRKPQREKSVWQFLTLLLPKTRAQINRRFLKVILKITRILGLFRHRSERQQGHAKRSIYQATGRHNQKTRISKQN